MFLKVSEVPNVSAGRSSTEPKLLVSEKGQVIFNKLATEKLLTNGGIASGDVKKIFLDWTPERKLSFTLKVPKGVKEDDGFPANVGKTSERVNFSGAGLFRHLKYDFEKSGSQIFSIHSNGSGMLSITLPEFLEPRPKVERKPRAKKNAEVKEQVPEPEAELAMI